MSDDTVLQLERLIAAPPERVFEYWTDPDLLVRWLGPEGYDIPAHAQDATPGGRGRTTMRGADGRQLTVSGVYRTVDPPRRLVFFNKGKEASCPRSKSSAYRNRAMYA